MDRTTILVIGGLALVWMAMRGTNEPKYFVPGVGAVPVSQLPSYGYQYVNGNWYSQSQTAVARCS